MNGKFPFVPNLVRLTYSKIYVKKNKITVTNKNNIDLKKGPYIVMSNHCGAYDPIIINSVLPVFVRWVAGAYLFKTKFMNIIFSKFAKCIAKQQGRSDFSTIRAMQKALKEKDNIGIFPEGTRTWDGDMMPIADKTLAKMIRSFKTDVVFVNLEGCYAQQPRWAEHYRSGQGINVNFKSRLTAEEIASMELEDIQNAIKTNLSFSNDAWKKKNPYNYTSDKRAEGAQRLFYMCPKCHSIGKMQTSGNTITCSCCNATAEVTEKDDIKSKDFKFKTFPQWHKWEASELAAVESFDEEPGVLFQKGTVDDSSKLETISTDIKIHLNNRVLKVTTDTGLVVELPYENITSMVLNAKQTIELVYNNSVYRLRLLPDSSSLKYHEHFLNYLNSQKEE